jgi:hypothetical protein
MYGYGTEVTVAITSSVSRDCKPDGFKCPHRPPCCIIRVDVPFIVQIMNMVQFLARWRKLRRILDQIPAVLFLAKTFSGYRISVFIKNFKQFNELGAIRRNLGMGGEFYVTFFFFRGNIADSADIRNRSAAPDVFCQFESRFLPPSIVQNIGLGVKKNGPPYTVGSVMIMGDASQARFNPADNNGFCFFEISANKIGICDNRQVRTSDI